MKFWRTTASFTVKDHQRSVRVEGRVHIELAYTKEEAIVETRKYLESWHYEDIEITEAHEETDEEKYGKDFSWNKKASDYTEEEKKVESEPVKTEVVSASVDELF